MASRVFFVVVVFLLLESRCPGQQSSAPLSEASGVVVEPMNDIIAVWEQRSEKVRAAAYWWSAAETFPDPEALGDRSAGTSRVFVTKKRKGEIYLGGGSHVRYVRSGPFWKNLDPTFDHFAGLPSGYYDYAETTTFDGAVCMNFLGEGYPGKAKWAYVGTGYLYRDNLKTLPVVLAHRPFSAGVTDAFNIREWTVSGRENSAEGGPCVIIEKSLAPPGRVWQMLLDPSRDYLPLEIRHRFNETLIDHIEIAYDRSSEAGWQCVAWTVTEWHVEDGNVKQAISVNVDKAKFNEGAPSVDFGIDLPRGTIVQDSRDQTITVIRYDGTTSRFHESDPGEIELGSPRRLSRLWLFVAAIILLLCVACIVCRRQSRG